MIIVRRLPACQHTNHSTFCYRMTCILIQLPHSARAMGHACRQPQGAVGKCKMGKNDATDFNKLPHRRVVIINKNTCEVRPDYSDNVTRVGKKQRE